MSHTVALINQLRNKKFRITQLRKTLIEELGISKKPLSAGEIIEHLKKEKVIVHKTSVYRELAFLLEQGVVRKITFGEKKDRFELAIMHHHHAVCQKCGEVEDLLHVEKKIKQIEQTLSQKQFKVEHHLVEFLGLCKKCQ
ncbi:Fur family transcriptional regulator, ferric uptake regulator [Candidatus Hakubella thermalkaliphila]|uniref:Fur family transcriptional regulator, ferric uptake regulator n=1 Tax=Candidatus Hakubella thermalkaliphila TaxID=2754717 RepID=A0A6V8P8M6_9ACTN|nr:transcriptional repressor [Candidatus Hakubella thermalkaliphila]MBT9170611.1 Peroxide-responsive repressor PerR [Actinomycetota bacterium]GFP19172.1 Fur family transcriptional regulator, ferric uptake regulator [Candidatus Hakubella thermalkaliphila]GFP21694.1 Fur family transcriptional regulator, ferric uptake regulator [Candidatus Hakubella thermalkaliphila]GFP22588.1 Fur family transcriptional regulator, peroxide stress response regulator [Candidatus Hakubella thermalkaliphila]GFP27166.